MGRIINVQVFFKEFIPYCEERGLSKDVILDIMTNNPAEFYDIK